MKLIKEGSSRKVFDLGDECVLKVPKNKRGIQECHNEWEIYTHIPPDMKKHLCPIISYENGNIKMPKINVLKKEEFHIENHQKIIEFLMETYDADEFDLQYHFNWGVYNGIIVILDYGHNYFEDWILL